MNPQNSDSKEIPNIRQALLKVFLSLTEVLLYPHVVGIGEGDPLVTCNLSHQIIHAAILCILIKLPI